MDDDSLDLDSADFAPGELTAERLALDEAQDLLRLLQTVAQEDGALSRPPRVGASGPGVWAAWLLGSET